MRTVVIPEGEELAVVVVPEAAPPDAPLVEEADASDERETEAPERRPVPQPTGLPFTMTVSVGSVVSPEAEAIVKRVVHEVGLPA